MKPETPETSLPLPFAVVEDGRRRAGLRVVRARVLTAFDWCARVREVRDRRAEHWLAIDRLAKHPRRAGRIVREALAKISAPPPEEAQSAAIPVAGTTGGSAAEPRPQWWQRD
jgi:hypothetical protein